MPLPTGWSRGTWLGAAAVGASLVLGAGVLTTFPMGRDQGIFAVVAEVMAHGGLPYRDAWDMKPPGIFLVYLVARAIFGAGELAPRLLEAGLLLGTCLGLWRLVVLAGAATGRAVGAAGGGPSDGPPTVPSLWTGAGAALLYLAWYLRLDFWHTGQPEGFGGMAGVAALLLVGPGAAGRGPARAAAAGLLLGFASLMKPSFVLDVPLVAALWRGGRAARGAGRRGGWAGLAALLLGAAVGAGAPLLWLVGAGVGPDLRWTFLEFLPGYAALDRSEGSGVLLATLRELARQLGPVGLVGLAAAPLAARRPGGLRALLLLAAALLVVQLLGAAAQGKFFAYHYAGGLPFAALLAASGLSALAAPLAALPAAPRRLAGLAATTGLGALVLSGGVMQPFEGTLWSRSLPRLAALPALPEGRVALDQQLTIMYDYHLPGARAAAAFIAAHTPPGSPLFVWGFEPELHVFADRPPASRFFYSVPARAAWSAAAARPLLLADLAAHPPAAVVVGRADALPWVTGDDQTSAQALPGFPELAALLAADFGDATLFTGLEVYLRRAPAPP